MESVVALFETPQQATNALQALQSRGFDRKNLGFACLNSEAQNEVATSTGIRPKEGTPAGSGGVIKGCIMGGIAGLALTGPVWMLLGMIPATQVYVDGGMFSALFGAIGGITLGGLFGAISGSEQGDYVRLLRSFGMPVAHAERVYRRLLGGRVLVVAHNSDAALVNEAAAIMYENGALSLEKADPKEAPRAHH